jgi:O-antigen/teichoic acid export membrane protein
VLVLFGAFGIFASSGLAATIALLLSLYYLRKKFNYSLKFTVYKNVLGTLWKFSASNYISNILNIIPIIVIPMIIIESLGEAQAGYYYLAFMLANLLYAVAYSVSQALFAEGSYGEDALSILFKRATLILSAIMIPAGLALALVGPILLQIFGKTYGQEGRWVIIILALSAPAVAAYILSGIYLRITDRIYALIAVNAIYACTITGLCFLWASRGLIWIAIAWLIGHIVTALVSALSIYFSPHTQKA